MSSQEWGWFIAIEIPYIEPIKNRNRNKNKNKNKLIKSSYIKDQSMPSIEEKDVYNGGKTPCLKKKKSMNFSIEIPEIIQHDTLIETLDKKYDFGNVFAGILVNTMLFCGACLYFKTGKF